jgi:rRNA maturation endonuclease Nob1
MEFAYQCPICRAKNILTKENTTCRRCGSNLELVYQTKKEKILSVLNSIAKG